MHIKYCWRKNRGGGTAMGEEHQASASYYLGPVFYYIKYCLLSAVCCLLSAGCWLLAAVCCLLSAVCCLLSTVCCLLLHTLYFMFFFLFLKVRENQQALTGGRSGSWVYQMLPWNFRRISRVITGTEDPGHQVRILSAWR